MISILLATILPWHITVYDYSYRATIDLSKEEAIRKVVEQADRYRRWCGYDKGEMVEGEIKAQCEEQAKEAWFCEARQSLLCWEKK